MFLLLVPFPLALLGLMLSIDAWRMIQSSFQVMARWHLRRADLLDASPDEAALWREDGPRDAAFARRETSFRRSSGFSQHSPWLFGAGWIHLAGVTLYLYVAHA